MSEPSSNPHSPKGLGTASLTLGGIAAGFGVAACCALPMLLASVGIGSAWLAGIAMAALPYRVALLAIGALCLLAGAALLVRQQAAAARCASDAACTSRVTRLITLPGLLIGAILLWLGYVYV